MLKLFRNGPGLEEENQIILAIFFVIALIRVGFIFYNRTHVTEAPIRATPGDYGNRTIQYINGDKMTTVTFSDNRASSIQIGQQ